MMNISLVGPTCAGKTTCAEVLRDTFRLKHLSTGKLLREHRDQQTALGILTRRYVEQGLLVPDEFINAMIEETVRQLPADQGLLLDGFPSTLFQARYVDELFQTMGRKLDAVFFMQASANAVFERAAKRPNRPDDHPDILRRRLEIFRRNTAPTLDYFRQDHRLQWVDASGSVNQVVGTLNGFFDQVAQGRFVPVLTDAQNRELDQLLSPPVREQVSRRQPSLDILLMGAPGSGKGTHAAFLSEKLGIPHIATGNLFRENTKENTILGRIARGFIERGQLVPDDVTEAMVRERLRADDSSEGFILDGYPRTLVQAQALDEIMAEMGRKLDTVLFLQVPEDSIIGRISGRRVCTTCQTPYHVEFNPPKQPGICDRDGSPLYQREDDKPETIRTRMQVYRRMTTPVVDYYRQAGLLMDVPAAGDVAQVDAALTEAMARVQRR
ncbi:MAG: adenylate kinase [Verrucomicrobiota bacterium]